MLLIVRVIAIAALLLLSHFAVYRWAAVQAVVDQQLQNIEQLTQMLNTTEELTRDANAASLALGKTISTRQQADAAATVEIRNALKTTAHLRVDCVFDDGVMRLLTATRLRANTAAASGINHPVPSTAAAR
jgi:hypothetical protein